MKKQNLFLKKSGGGASIIKFIGIFPKFNLFIILLFGMIISSCDKEDPHNDVEILKSRSVNSVNTYRDDDYRDLARVLSIGVEENLSLRNLLKNEAILKYDGDYDILVNKIKNEQLTTSSGQQSFSEYIGSIYARLNLSPKISGTEGGGAGGTTTTIFPTVINYTATHPSGIRVILNSSDIIPYLVSVYPIIQISIPVHADSWDVTTYPPICIYVPEDYNEPTTLTIEGFDNGTSVTVDAVNEPNEPVIVVSDSERANIAEALADPPNVSIQLTAVQSATGITLSWTVTNPNNDVIGGYKIYKKTLFSNSFVAIADNLGKENTLYNDNEVDALLNYFYYVKAFNAMGESESSNVATAIAPSVPNAPESFSANHYVQDEIELKWTFPQGQYITSSNIYKRVIGVHSDYILAGSIPSPATKFIDYQVEKGKRVNYLIELVNNQGNSNHKFDFIHVPYRNVGVETPLILHKITYESALKKEIEGWPRGKPEFKISIAKANQTGEAAIVQSAMEFYMKETTLIKNKLLLNWLPGDWAETLTFSVIEFDGGPNIDLNLNAGFDFKNPDKTLFINGSANVTFKDITNAKDENCGKREHKYLNAPSPVLEFPLGGVKLHLTN